MFRSLLYRSLSYYLQKREMMLLRWVRLLKPWHFRLLGFVLLLVSWRSWRKWKLLRWCHLSSFDILNQRRNWVLSIEGWRWWGRWWQGWPVGKDWILRFCLWILLRVCACWSLLHLFFSLRSRWWGRVLIRRTLWLPRLGGDTCIYGWKKYLKYCPS